MDHSYSSMDAEELLSMWRLVSTGKALPPDQFFPVITFPTDGVRDLYLRRIDGWPEEEIRSVLRNMLGESRNLPVHDELQLAILQHTHRSRELDSAAGSQPKDRAAERPKVTEYERRLIFSAAGKTTVPVWEGLAWVLDLLPHAPGDALEAVSAYVLAHWAAMPDMRITAMFDAQSVIRARYIGHDGDDFEQQVEVLLSLHWREFEYLVSALYRAQKYETLVTPPSKDRGKDVVASKASPPEELFIQCKNWRGKVDVEVASALVGRVEMARATRGVLIATSGFTAGPASARELAEANPRLELIDGAHLVQLLNQHLGRDWSIRVDRIIDSERSDQAKRSK
jgi:restriction system protein